MRHRPRKVTSVPPPQDLSRVVRESTTLPTTVTTTTNSHLFSSSLRGGIKVRKVGHVSAPVDPLRTRSSTAGKTTSIKTVSSAPSDRRTETGTNTKKNIKKREQKPPHNRSWALRPATTNVVSVHLSDMEMETSETVSVSSEKPSLVPLGMKTQSEEQREGEGRAGRRTDLSQMLQELEASSAEQGESEGQRKTTQVPKRLFPSSSSTKRRKLTGELCCCSVSFN